MGRISNSDPPVFEIELTHRPSGRRFEIELSGQEFMQSLTGMGFIHGKFTERIYPQKKESK